MKASEKKVKKAYISTKIDLARGRYKDSEIEILEDLIRNAEEYNGKSKTYKTKLTYQDSDGMHTRNEETTYFFCCDHRGIHIDEVYRYQDDDGQSDGVVQAYTTGREILRVVPKIFKKNCGI